jgi:hypothetical protein
MQREEIVADGKSPYMVGPDLAPPTGPMVPQLVRLMRLCLAANPDKRPTMQKVLDTLAPLNEAVVALMSRYT